MSKEILTIKAKVSDVGGEPPVVKFVTSIGGEISMEILNDEAMALGKLLYENVSITIRREDGE